MKCEKAIIEKIEGKKKTNAQKLYNVPLNQSRGESTIDWKRKRYERK